MSGSKRVFKSFEELRRHFFPKQFTKEQQQAEIEIVLDESKYDRPKHKRQLGREQIEEMGK
jgi:hypothetical protein